MLIALVLFFTRRELVKWISILFHHLHLLDLLPLTCRPFVIWAKCGGTDGKMRLHGQHCWFSTPFSVTMIMTLVPVLTLLRRICRDVSANKTEAPFPGSVDQIWSFTPVFQEVFEVDLRCWGHKISSVEPKPDLCTHSQTLPDLLLVSDPVCGLNGQDRMRRVWFGCFLFADDVVLWCFQALIVHWCSSQTGYESGPLSPRSRFFTGERWWWVFASSKEV